MFVSNHIILNTKYVWPSRKSNGKMQIKDKSQLFHDVVGEFSFYFNNIFYVYLLQVKSM